MSSTFPPQPPGNLLPPLPGSTASQRSGPYASSTLGGWADLRQAVNVHLVTGLRNTNSYLVAARRQLQHHGRRGR